MKHPNSYRPVFFLASVGFHLWDLGSGSVFLKYRLQPCTHVLKCTSTICLVCVCAQRCMCVTVMAIDDADPSRLTKDSLFSTNQCFQFGHYYFTISSIIINNSVFCYKVFTHACTKKDTHTHTVYLVY